VDLHHFVIGSSNVRAILRQQIMCCYTHHPLKEFALIRLHNAVISVKKHEQRNQRSALVSVVERMIVHQAMQQSGTREIHGWVLPLLSKLR